MHLEAVHESFLLWDCGCHLTQSRSGSTDVSVIVRVKNCCSLNIMALLPNQSWCKFYKLYIFLSLPLAQPSRNKRQHQINTEEHKLVSLLIHLSIQFEGRTWVSQENALANRIKNIQFQVFCILQLKYLLSPLCPVSYFYHLHCIVVKLDQIKSSCQVSWQMLILEAEKGWKCLAGREALPLGPALASRTGWNCPKDPCSSLMCWKCCAAYVPAEFGCQPLHTNFNLEGKTDENASEMSM